MYDLFGDDLPRLTAPQTRPKRPVSPSGTSRKNGPVFTGLRRPTGKNAGLWQTFGFTPQPGQVVHFNSGSGYDLARRRRNVFTHCFGFVLAVNADAGEVLVHLPKERSRYSADEFYVVAFHDLLPTAVVEGFDEAGFRHDHPVLPPPAGVVWDVTPL